METYLLKFSACLLVFWLVYILVLERQKMHIVKRFYLLGAFVVSLTIPFLTITEYIEPITRTLETSTVYFPIEMAEEMPIEEPPLLTLENILWIIYGLGVLVFGLRFIINIIKLYRRIIKNERVRQRSYIYVLLKEYQIPHSFFRYIFLNKLRFNDNAIPKEVLVHEEAHAKQLHSLDIVIIEFLQIIFWFHPLIYILKHHIKLNHEFMADQAVLKQGSDTKTYQNILLQFSSSGTYHFPNALGMTSAINYSSIKKRFTVMKTQTSKTRVWLSTFLLLPIVAVLFYSFAEREYVEKESPDLIESIKKELEEAEKLNIVYVDGATEALMKEYRDFIEEYNKTKVIYGHKYERAVIIYDEIMTDAQRAKVEKYPERKIPEPNLSKVIPKKPTSKQLEAFKNDKEYAVWVDGKHVPNLTLNNYTVEDFVHHTGSKVYKNARSEKFPQPYQYHLYTKDGFKKTYQESQVKKYKVITNKYSTAISEYLKGNQTDNSELKILKAQADKIYNSFSAEELKVYNILSPAPVPAQKNNQEWNKVNDILDQKRPIMWILVNRKGQLLVDDEIGTYESIEKKLKELSKTKNSNRIVSIKFDPEVPKKIVNELTSLVQKNGFEVITIDATQIPPPPPPPPAPKKSKGGPNFPDTQEFYNPSFLDYIIEMEKEGASFYLDGSKISVEKAKDLATNHKGKCTEMTTQKDERGNYLVKLSTSETKKLYARSIDLKILNNDSYLIDGIRATKNTFANVFNQLHQDISYEDRNRVMNIHVTSPKTISDKEVWFIYNSLQDYGFYRIVTPNQEINRAKGNTPYAINNRLLKQQKLPTQKEVSDYNAWAKKINNESKALSNESTFYPPINEQDLVKFSDIYKRMSSQQKNKAIEFPFPGLDTKDKRQERASKKQINAYNTWAKKMAKAIEESSLGDFKGSEYAFFNLKEFQKFENIYIRLMTPEQRKNAEPFPKLVPPPPPPAPPTPENPKRSKNEEDVPPPPAPENTLDFVIRMAKKGAEFFNEGQSISSDKAIELLKKNSELNINAQKTETKQPLVYISKKPMLIGINGKVDESQNETSLIVNGNLISSPKIKMTIEEIKKLKLTLKGNNITSFKFKIPGIKTEYINGNKATSTTQKNLRSAKTGDSITVFDIKYGDNSKLPPLIIEVIE